MPPIDDSPFLPFFVYGTLLPGQPNEHYWRGLVDRVEPAGLPNATLYSMGFYPMLVEQPESHVVGMLITVQEAHFTTVLRALDQLEHYNPLLPQRSLYQRVIRTVTRENGLEQPAWVYLGNAAMVENRPHIAHGDWVTYIAKHDKEAHQFWMRHGEAYNQI